MNEPKDPLLLRPTATLTLGEASAAAAVPTVLERGSSLGRYVVLDLIGGGGMGVVYTAFDPELDRKVALKLLRVELFESSDGYEARMRLLREAQALAKLAHPNVVAVHDVGTYEGQVFIAMEFVEGRTLSEWVSDEKPEWREIVQIFLQAGRGLAAAHAAGLVHRDFKPSNVVLGEDGRVRVLDFGLAAPLEALSTRGQKIAVESIIEARRKEIASPLTANLTRTGSTLGTPAYMAPEQHQQQNSDSRSDQFSFCASLYEALYGELPFVGANLKELLINMRTGGVREPAVGSKVPLWLRRVLLRGLQLEPEKRYPSMQALLQGLTEDPSARYRRWGLVGGGLLLGAVAFLGLYLLQQSRVQLCSGAETRLQEIWNGSRREAVRTAFLVTAAPFAADTWNRVSSLLDRYGERWASGHQEACAATRLRGEQSEELLDRRMICLEGRWREFDALIGLFAHADRQILETSVKAINSLSPVAGCADIEGLNAQTPLPADQGVRRQIAAVEELAVAAKAQYSAGKYQQSEELGRAAVAKGDGVDYPPGLCVAYFELGRALIGTSQYAEAENVLVRAASLADEGGLLTVRINAMLELVHLLGNRLDRRGEAERYLELIEGVTRRRAGGAVQVVHLKRQEALLELAAGNSERAKEVALEALQSVRQVFGDQEINTALVLELLSAIYLQRRELAAAIENQTAVLEIRRARLGPDHPDVGLAESNLGIAKRLIGRYEEAIELQQRALPKLIDKHGENSYIVARALTSQGLSLSSLSRWQEALEMHRQALTITELLGNAREISRPLNNIALVHWARGEYSQAVSYFRRALAIRESIENEHEKQRVGLLSNLGRTLTEAGQAREGLHFSRRSHRLAEAWYEPSHLWWSDSLLGVGEALEKLGRDAAAREALERSLDLFLVSESPTGEYVGDARSALARLFWRRGEHDRALVEAEQAAASYRGLGTRGEFKAGRIANWLAEHGSTGGG